jgi:hypothetical protein
MRGAALHTAFISDMGADLHGLYSADRLPTEDGTHIAVTLVRTVCTARRSIRMFPTTIGNGWDCTTEESRLSR